MTKRAIKILLALAVMIATFAVITVVASAENRLVERVGAKPYYYLDDVHYSNEYYEDIPVVIMFSLGVCYDDVYFEELCSSEPYSIWLYDFGSLPGDSENYSFFSDNPEDSYNFFSPQLLYYSTSSSVGSDHYFAVVVLFVMDFSAFEFYPSSSGSGGSSGDSGNQGGNVPDGPSYSGEANSGSGRDNYPWIYDPTSKYTTDFFDDYYSCGVMDLYSFYLMSDVSYEYFFEDCLKYLFSHVSSPGSTYEAYNIYQCSFYLPDRSFYSYQSPYDELLLPEGEYYLMIEVKCSCSSCSGYEYFGLKVISTPTLTSDPVGNYEAYDRGYQSGYRDGYDNAKIGQDLLIQQNRNEAYEAGYESGHTSGYDAGYESGYSFGEASGYLIGYDQSIELNKGTWYNEGYDHGYEYGFEIGSFDNFVSSDMMYTEGYTAGYADGIGVTMSEGGNPISGFFNGISTAAINAFQYVSTNVRIGYGGTSITVLQALEWVLYFICAAFVIKLVIKFVFGALT